MVGLNGTKKLVYYGVVSEEKEFSESFNRFSIRLLLPISVFSIKHCTQAQSQQYKRYFLHSR